MGEEIQLAHTTLIYGVETGIVPTLHKGPRSVSELVRETNLNRSLLCYYLTRLQNCGIVEPEYRIKRKPTESTRGLAKQIYRINEQKLEEARQVVDGILSRLKALI